MKDRPHVVIIMADQLRFDALGSHTPNLNGLLSESVRFDRAYCASPLCVPARGAFFTGRYPCQTGCLINPWVPADRRHGLVAADTANLYELAAPHYDVWHTGKQHFLTCDGVDQASDSPIHWQSFERFYDGHLKKTGGQKPGGAGFTGLIPELIGNAQTHAREYSIPATGRYDGPLSDFFDGFICDTSIDAIRSRDAGRPFWLNAMFLAPHPPLEVPEPWYSQLSLDDVELPANVGVWSEGQSPLQMYHLPGFIGTRYSREQWHEVWRVYLGLVALLDHCVGRILDELKRQNIYDNTLVLFTSDHGEMLGSHRLWQKMCCYEESIRIPVAFKPPKVWPWTPGPRAGLVSHIDILPTLDSLLGLGAPDNLPGFSLQSVFENGGATDRERVFVQYDGNGAIGNISRCVVTDDWKLNVDRFKDEIYFELYQLSNDPLEMNNLALKQPKRVETLLLILSKHLRSSGDHFDLSRSDYSRFYRFQSHFSDKLGSADGN